MITVKTKDSTTSKRFCMMSASHPTPRAYMRLGGNKVNP